MLLKKYYLLLGVLFSATVFAAKPPIKTPELNNDSPIISFAVIGDYGENNDDEERVAELIDEAAPDFILTLGDNNYDDGCWDTIDKNVGKYYSKYIGNYQGDYGNGATVNRFFPTLGNHDWYAKHKCLRRGNLPYLEYFTALPGNGRYYDFVKGSVHFFALDSDDNEPDGNEKYSRQYYWLKEQIKNSKSCFNVVYFHHAPYSSGRHGSDKTMQWNFARLGADVVIAAHDHHYERIERNGITYFVNGSGGTKLRDVDSDDEVWGSKYHYDNRHGYMYIRANDEHMVMSFINEKEYVKDRKVFTKLCD